uniref:Cytochrome P450 n=1 Tax=Haemonchus contortus TaxID=6289 RepID=A0A7I4YSH5_HAECO
PELEQSGKNPSNKMGLIALAIASIAISHLLMWIPSLIRWLMHRVRVIQAVDRLPGPPALPLVGCAHKFSFDNYKFTYFMEDIFEKFSDGLNGNGMFRMWIGPFPVVCICRADAAKVILESSKEISKPQEGYTRLQEWLGRGLLTSNGERWRAKRKMLTPAFHFSILKDFMPIFNKEAAILLEQFGRLSDTGCTADVFPLIKLCTLDVICESAMGVNIRAQSGQNKNYVKSVKEVCELLWDRERLPWLWPTPLWILSGKAARLQTALTTVQGFTRAVIAKRKKVFELEERDPHRKPAFLDLLLEMQQANRLTDDDIREEVDTFMFEGHDTVASALGYALFCLGNYPEEQEKLFQEVKEVIGPEDRELTQDDLIQLKQTEKVLKEALRVFPPVPMIARRLHDDVDIGDITIPAGVTALVVPFGTHRDPKYFERPRDFWPDHFDVDSCSNRSAYAFIPWSAGPRNCIGPEVRCDGRKGTLSTTCTSISFPCHYDFQGESWSARNDP